MQYKIIIKRNGKEIDFDFTESIHSTWGGGRTFQSKENYFMIQRPYKQIKNLLYSVLACSRMDYYIDTDFNSFCNEFGYDKHEESTKELHYKCINQSLLLKEIFSENEIEYLPN